MSKTVVSRPTLDEPTIGLDPEGALEFLDMIRGLKADGLTVLLASHLLHQVQAVCDRVGLFHEGRIVLEGPVDALSERVLGGVYRIRVEVHGRIDALEQTLAATPGVARVTRDPRGYVVEARSDVRGALAQRIVAAGGTLLGFNLERLGLDEVYARYFQEVRHAG